MVGSSFNIISECHLWQRWLGHRSDDPAESVRAPGSTSFDKQDCMACSLIFPVPQVWWCEGGGGEGGEEEKVHLKTHAPLGRAWVKT